MALFRARDLYGGAISAPLPSDYLDASSLRQIPDHQEVFLSPRTLTSLVFEINQYVSLPSVTGHPDRDIEPLSAPAGRATATATASPSQGPGDDYDDSAAALFHLRDLLDARDTLSSVRAPRRVRMQSASLSGAPAFVVHATLTTREEEANRHVAANDEGELSTTTIRLLLVRLRAQSTDLCVAVNVPRKELGRAGAEQEEAFAEALLQHLLGGLEVSDFALFAA